MQHLQHQTQFSWRNIALAIFVTATAFGARSQAQCPIDRTGMELEQVPATLRMPANASASKLVSEIGNAQVINNPRLISSPQTMQVAQTATQQDIAGTDLTGSWVMSYETLLQDGKSGGGEAVLKKADNSNSYIIQNFWSTGLEVSATIDPSTGIVTIPNQIFATTTDGAKVDVTAINPSTGIPLRSEPIKGKVNPDGSIAIETWWAVYLADKNEPNGGMFGAYYNTLLRRPNGQFSFVQNNQTSTVPVYAVQTAENVLEVTNLLNGGLTVEMTLNRNLTATIGFQPVITNTNADYNICNATIEGEDIKFTYPITTAVASNPKVISWTNWTGYGITSAGKPAWLGMFTEGTITFDNDIKYPSVSTTSLKGAGTKENPWLISSKDDLIYLSDMVNSQPASKNICDGEYFKLTADIDMSKYRFTAISKDYDHIFNGIFDGDGHTIEGLTIVAPANTYAGLFGRTGEQSLITNLTIKNASISAQAFAGCAVAWSTGEVSNVNIHKSTVTNSSNGTGAVANIVRKITNCHADSCNITGMQGFVGGLVGQLNESMSACSATNMRIVGASAKNNPSPTGGLAGMTNFQSEMTDSYFSGTIDTASNYTVCYTGGLAGSSQGGTMERCFFVGTVRGYSADSYTGGLIGYAMSANIIDCYANGRVDNPTGRRTGGLTGFLTNGTYENETVPGTIKNSYSSAAMLAETYMYNPETERRELFGIINTDAKYTFENCYFNKQLVNFGSTQYGVLTSDLVAASGPEGFSPDTWIFQQGQYPRLKGIDQNQAALYSSSALIMHDNSSLNKLSQDASFNALGETDFGYLKNGQIVKQGYYSNIDGNSIILNSDFNIGTDTIFIVNGRAQYHYFLKVAPVPFSGEGTKDNPYLISTASDLVKLSEMTTASGQTFPGVYFMMTNDIDLEYTDKFLGIMCNDKSTAAFAGIFDGNGHAVHRMKLIRTVWTTEPTETSLGTIDTKSVKSYQGFVGRLAAEGTVRNLTLAADCKIELGGYSGAIVGYNFGHIENCRNLADVVTYHGVYVGGITGYNNSTETCVVANCYNAGNITSGRYAVGGITGVNYNLVKECVNTGNVITANICTNYNDDSKHSLAGGITGTMNGRIENCINYGTVSSYEKVGGLSGSLALVTGASFIYKNDVINSINLGIVYSKNQALCGAIGGESGTNGNLTGSYWDAQLLPISAIAGLSADGLNGANTNILTSGEALEGYDTRLWDFKAGKYPALKARAEEDAVKRSREIIVNIPVGADAYKLAGKEASLAVADGMKWSLAYNNQFSIKDNVLYGPANVSELVSDTLYAEYGNIVKPILIKAVPPMPLAGEGTEDKPYLVTSAADWNALASYMALTNNSLEEKHVAIDNDIDFNQETFSPLAGDGVTYLNGSLDGRGHTVSGIKLNATTTFAGAIGTVGTTGVVKNLTLAGEISSTPGSVGGFTGRLYGKLENCVNAINVTTAKSIAGGFAATFFSEASLTDCVNRGNISALSNVGGFAGTFDKASNVIMTKCTNEGTITGNTTKAYAGGLVGTAYPSIITECKNTGNVTVVNKTTQTFAAGLIAFATGNANAEPYLITKCSNTGNISAKSGVAGLIGDVNATAGNTVLNITYCTNSGNISALGTANTSNTANAGIAAMITAGSTIKNSSNTGKVTVGANTNTGGITGYTRVAGTASKNIRIEACTNSGEIIAQGANTGGIIGNAAAYTYVDNCSNTAAVTGEAAAYAIGGIAGALTNVNTAITRSWNIGNVTTSANRAGGIVGMNAQKAVITDCWNAGNITSLSDLQGVAAKSGYGIGGVAGQSASVLTRCYNLGTIKGASRIGGVIGAPTKDNTQLVNCYNAGRIDAPADTCGNLVGVSLVNNGTIWTAKNSITGCYYVTDFGVFENTGSEGTPVTIAGLTTTDLGQGWNIPAEYSLPISDIYTDNEAAMLFSAAVILGEGDTYEKVTSDFNLGTPGNVAWTASANELTIDGNMAKFNSSYNGEIVLTAKTDNYSRTVTINADVKVSGIDNIESDSNTPAEYYNMQGLRVYNPAPGQLYIVRRGDVTTKELYR